MKLSIDRLAQIAECSHGVASAWLTPLENAMRAFDIDSSVRAAAFLAQVVHESEGFTLLSENLHYSASRLVAIWPGHFSMSSNASPGLHDATEVANRPEAIANIVYANRMGNGSPQSGDGWRFRGRGLIQLTGRQSYTRAAQDLAIDLINDPDLLLLETHAANSAAWYWSEIDGNSLADEDSAAAFEKITIAINGGLIGIHERTMIWTRAKALLPAGE